MFYYKLTKKPKLDIYIVENYTQADMSRIFLFIDALFDSPKMNVVFKVHPSVKTTFQETIIARNWQPQYAYQIKENIA